jgi:phosphoribosylformylglycinamidine (FGAM) synthase-like amidotransferase family enzyme
MSSRRVQAVIPTGFGINCEAETAHALTLAGAEATQIHLNDLVAGPETLARSQILVLAGGFSFGDHLGAGKVFANRLWRRLGEQLRRFVDNGGLVLGICNGFQTMVRLGLVPRFEPPRQQVALGPNQHGCFYDGWVSLRIDPASPCVFTRGIASLEVPVRHGEGRLLASAEVLEQIDAAHLAPVRYVDPASREPTDAFPHNPNGSLHAIAGLCDWTGRVFGLMPHPEAFLYPECHPTWRRRPEAGQGEGLQIFRNAVAFVENR